MPKCPDCKEKLVLIDTSTDEHKLADPYYHCSNCNQDYDIEGVEE